MNEEYQKGKEIGELVGEVKALREEIKTNTEEQKKWNMAVELRLQIAEQWIQTTTGKVVILTTVFGIVGSIFYVGINWLIAHFR